MCTATRQANLRHYSGAAPDANVCIATPAVYRALLNSTSHVLATQLVASAIKLGAVSSPPAEPAA